MKTKTLIVLAGSIAQLVRAAVIETNSPVTGNWSDPNSWLGGVPDTYGFDSAIIHAGDVIDYDSGVSTPGGIVGPGGLSVIGGNFITIDGGTLTQNILTNEIRIGEGSGGAGDGILTIDNAGTFNSGAALAVAIGASLNATNGSGIVNLNDGTFTMGAGAAAGGLVVGVDGSTGVFNLGDGTGVAGTAILDLATNNIGLGIGYLFSPPPVVGGTGTVTIKSDGVLNLGTGGIAVGNGGGTATLAINGGVLNGLVAGGGAINVGDGDGSTGTLTIDADGSLTNSGAMRIGVNGGNGTLTVTSGTLALTDELNIGIGVGSAPSVGLATISGGVVTTGTTLIGRDGGSGTLVLGGATTSFTANGNFYIGTGGSNGVVTMTGGTLTTTAGVIEVGASGTGAMTITGGTVSSSAESRVGQGAAGSGVLNISGSTVWTVNGEFQDGNDGGTGEVNMSGGELIANSWFGIGRTGGTGVFNLSGGQITKGTGPNTGTLDISTYNNGAAVTTGTLKQTGGTVLNLVSQTNIGRDAGNVGFWNMKAGTATLADFHIANEGVGTMTIDGTDPVTITTTGQLEIGANGAAALGILNISNPNATITVGTEMQLGRGGSRGEVHQSAGVIVANGGWFGLANDGTGPSALYDLTGGELHVNTTIELGADGDGVFNVGGNGVLTAQNIHLAQRGGTGTLNVGDNGSVNVSGQLVVGFGSANDNVANILGGTVVTGTQTIVGEGAGHVGTMNIAAGSLTVGDEFQIGNDDGTGTVNMTGGAVQINQWGAIGRNGGTGTLNFSGGTITMAVNNRTFDIGVFGDANIVGSVGTGTMNQSGGELINLGADTTIARDVTSVGVWNMEGGTATLNGLRIGASGNGTMNILGTEPVIVNANNIRIGGEYNLAGVGVLNISNPNAVITSQFEMGTGRNGGHGEVHQSAGIVNAGGGWFGIANDPQDGSQPVSGIYDISGGQLNAPTANIELGADGNGQLLVTGTAQVTSGGLTAGVRAFGTGTLLLADTASINVSGNIVIGNGSANANLATITGGTMTSGNITAIGNNAGSVGTMNISGGLVTANGEFWTGNGGGSGVLNMTGGAIVANSWFDLGRDSGTGIVNLIDGSITKLNTVANSQMNIGSSGTGHGTLNQSGGTITTVGADTLVARDPQTVGLWDISKGTANLANLYVGSAGNGTMNIHGTDTVTITTNGLRVGGEGGATGIGSLIISNPNATITTNNEVGIGRNGGHGEVHQSAGIVNAGGGWFGIANDGGSGVFGLYDISGGQLNVLSPTTSIELGADGSGELRVSGTAVVTAGNIHVSQRTTGTGTLNVSDSASVTAAGQIVVGFGSSNANVANFTGGTVSTGAETIVGGGFNVPDPINNPTVSLPNVGTLNITGPGTWTSGGEFQVGNDGGIGVANISAGHLIAKTYVAIGRNTPNNDVAGVPGANGANGTINLSGTGIIEKIDVGLGGSFDIGSWNGTHPETTNTFGTLNQDGGAIINTVSDTHIGRDTGVVGVWNINAGTANLARLNVGNDGTGTLNMTGGSISAADHVAIASGATSTGTANLNGGVLATKFVEAGAGIAALNLNGGTLKALADEGDFLRNINPANSEVLAGGVIFDTNGFNIAVNNQFDGAGGLVKNGEGNLTVSNPANGNTGGTIVNRGNVIYPVISAAGPGTVDILINGPGAAALDGTDLTPLQARTIATSNGAIALHDNTASVALDFTAYPNLSLGSVGTSTYGLALTPGGGNYRLGGGGGTLTVSTVLTGANGLVVNGNGLTGTVVLSSQETYTGPTNVAGGTAVLAGGTDTLPNTALTIGATGTVNLNGNAQTVASLSGATGSILANTGAASIFTTGGDNTSTVYGGLITGPISVVKIGTGTQTISAPQTYSALSVNAGAVVLGGTNHLGALSLASDTTVTLSAHTGDTTNVKTIDTSALTLAGNAKLDLTNNAMVVRGGDFNAVFAKVLSGFNGGAEDGPGIISSTAAADTTFRTTIGIINNADAGYTDFAGITGLTGNETLIKYTWFGDNDLSGRVDNNDFGLFNDGFNQVLPATWLTGDYDYSGHVDNDDYGLFTQSFNTQEVQLRDPALVAQLNDFALQIAGSGSSGGGGGGQGGAGDGLGSGAGQAVVPEPGSIGLLAVGALGLLARRRRATRRA